MANEGDPAGGESGQEIPSAIPAEVQSGFFESVTALTPDIAAMIDEATCGYIRKQVQFPNLRKASTEGLKILLRRPRTVVLPAKEIPPEFMRFLVGVSLPDAKICFPNVRVVSEEVLKILQSSIFLKVFLLGLDLDKMRSILNKEEMLFVLWRARMFGAVGLPADLEEFLDARFPGHNNVS